MQRVRTQSRAARAAAVQSEDRRDLRCAADRLHQRSGSEGDGEAGCLISSCSIRASGSAWPPQFPLLAAGWQPIVLKHGTAGLFARGASRQLHLFAHQQNFFCLVDAGGEISRSALIRMKLHHQSPMGSANLLSFCACLETENVVGLFAGHSPMWLAIPIRLLPSVGV